MRSYILGKEKKESENEPYERDKAKDSANIHIQRFLKMFNPVHNDRQESEVICYEVE